MKLYFLAILFNFPVLISPVQSVDKMQNQELYLLQKKINRCFWYWNQPKVLLLPEDQMLIRKNMMKNPSAKNGIKENTLVPAKNGYNVYLSYSSAEKDAERQQLRQQIDFSEIVVHWQPGESALRMEENLKMSWQIISDDQMVCRVRVKCGSSRVRGQVNKILKVISNTLLD